MFDIGLTPCPLCGGKAEVVELRQGFARLDAVIRCEDCGLTLDWQTEYKVGINLDGSRVVVKDSLDPFERWNTRPDDVYRKELEALLDLPNCNDCGRDDCPYKPLPGERVRANCPIHESKKE